MLECYWIVRRSPPPVTIPAEFCFHGQVRQLFANSNLIFISFGEGAASDGDPRRRHESPLSGLVVDGYCGRGWLFIVGVDSKLWLGFYVTFEVT